MYTARFPDMISLCFQLKSCSILQALFLVELTLLTLLSPVECHPRQPFYGDDSPSRQLWDHEPVKWNQDPEHDPVPINDVLQLLFASNFPTAVASNISTQCVADSQRYISSLAKQTKWALMSRFMNDLTSILLNRLRKLLSCFSVRINWTVPRGLYRRR